MEIGVHNELLGLSLKKKSRKQKNQFHQNSIHLRELGFKFHRWNVKEGRNSLCWSFRSFGLVKTSQINAFTNLNLEKYVPNQNQYTDNYVVM